MTGRDVTERLALKLLKREGIASIWQLHLDAASAYRDGYADGAGTLLQIADAAERQLRRDF